MPKKFKSYLDFFKIGAKFHDSVAQIRKISIQALIGTYIFASSNQL